MGLEGSLFKSRMDTRFTPKSSLVRTEQKKMSCKSLLKKPDLMAFVIILVLIWYCFALVDSLRRPELIALKA